MSYVVWHEVKGQESYSTQKDYIIYTVWNTAKDQQTNFLGIVFLT